jgi:hypothetical protein
MGGIEALAQQLLPLPLLVVPILDRDENCWLVAVN